MAALTFIILIVYLIAGGMAASEFNNIAAMKGHSHKNYFWWCFLFSFVGYAMVIALPDHSNSKTTSAKESNDELPEL